MFQLINRLSMMKKLLVGPLVVILFVLVLAGMAYQGLVGQKKALSDIYQVEFRDYQVFAKILQEVGAIHGNVNKLMNWITTNTDKTRVEELEKAQGAALGKNVALVDKLLLRPSLEAEEKKKLQTALDQLKAYQKVALAAIDMSSADVNSAAMMVSSSMEEKFQPLNKTLQEMLAIQQLMDKTSLSMTVADEVRNLAMFKTEQNGHRRPAARADGAKRIPAPPTRAATKGLPSTPGKEIPPPSGNSFG